MFSCSATHRPSRQCYTRCGNTRTVNHHDATRSTNTYRSVATGGALRGRPVGHTVAAGRIEAEQLRAHAIVLEASGRAAVAPTLRVQREQRAGQRTAERLVLVRGVVQAAGRVAAVRGGGAKRPSVVQMRA